MDNALAGVGIDLGTTNSVIAFVNVKPNGELTSKVVDVVRADDSYSQCGQIKYQQVKKPLLPSCVYYKMDNNFTPLVGDFAKRQYALRPQLTAKSIKSQMGFEEVQGLNPEIPDKTPAEVSSRILAHLLRTTEKSYRTKIENAVITVPANFDAAMCRATLEAAQLAGIRITNKDGSERPVLLSEPNAVIYDLMNQISKGEMPESVIDLSEARQVMVFDLGGGTLDITLHEIRYRDSSHSTVKVDEIATNRYTLLGGDDFDNALAEEMFRRCVAQYGRLGRTMAEKIAKEKTQVFPQFLVYAEGLKIDLSNSRSEEVGGEDLWEEDQDGFSVGGNLGNGYAYDDTFTKEDVEKVFERFMGRSLKFEDYARLDGITDKNNIIYPILDVLKKAADKKGGIVKVDEVILNGGMSRFYMVIERLKEFFGFEPITPTDPDQAVARGAAIYHYYLQKNEESMRSDMRMVGGVEGGYARVVRPLSSNDTGQSFESARIVSSSDSRYTSFESTRIAQAPVSRNATSEMMTNPARPRPAIGIEWGSSILNDALYLGLQNGAKEKELIPTGQILPYKSSLMTGFQIDAGNQKICLPIRSKDMDGTVHTIVKGNITLRKAYAFNTFVSFVIRMSPSKVLTMEAWISKDRENKEILESALVELAIGRAKNEQDDKLKTKVAAPLGTELNAVYEVQHLFNLLHPNSRTKPRSYAELSPIVKTRIKESFARIASCSNKEDFALPILSQLKDSTSEILDERFLTLARKIGANWSLENKRLLARICMDKLSRELNGLAYYGTNTNRAIAAIQCLAICGSPEDMQKLLKLGSHRNLNNALIFTFGRSGTNLDFLYNAFLTDCEPAIKGQSSPIQHSAQHLAYALRRDIHGDVTFDKAENVVNKMCDCLDSYKLKEAFWAPLVLSIGMICDQRFGNSLVGPEVLTKARECVDECAENWLRIRETIVKARGIALKMMNAEELNKEENEYLLKFCEAD